ncbi:ribosomal RNA small subunit methyltransferase A [Candidatus Aerophobetes bacterium]|nr:ribosomal RNA small subunit methyltransferase A [Candidatus Aerophobetes bacterium]
MKLKEKLEHLMAVYNLCPRASLSQNFLIDARCVSRLIEEIGLEEKDIVLEIGAGTGILTSHLLQKAGRVFAVEIDESLCKVMRDELKGKSNLKILCGDITKLALDSLFLEEDSVKVVGNLPYHIASRIILELVRKKWWELMVFTIQREVADKLLSCPGKKTRGALSVIVSYYTDVKKVMDIPPQAFYPAPRVTSTVVKIEAKKKKLVAEDEKFFLDVVKASFTARRKTLLNCLSRGLSLSREVARDILIKSKVPEKKRAEELEVEDFIRISNVLLRKKGRGKIAHQSD